MFDTVSKHSPADSVKRALRARADAYTPEKWRFWGFSRLFGGKELNHSHSMVPGGLLVMSSTTRLTSDTSLVMRVEMRSSTS